VTMRSSAIERSRQLGHRDGQRSEMWLRRTAIVFLIAVAGHGADHLRRGVDVVTTQVTSAGATQFLFTVIAVALVVRRHHWAPRAAIAIGFSSAIGFTAAHLLPHWSSFSDSFTGGHIAPKVTALSWATAVFEIGADVAFGWAGVRAFQTYERRDLEARAVRSGPSDE
jgi:Na+/proline symporter